jgi:hypothetical protein
LFASLTILAPLIHHQNAAAGGALLNPSLLALLPPAAKEIVATHLRHVDVFVRVRGSINIMRSNALPLKNWGICLFEKIVCTFATTQ